MFGWPLLSVKLIFSVYSLVVILDSRCTNSSTYSPSFPISHDGCHVLFDIIVGLHCLDCFIMPASWLAGIDFGMGSVP